MPAPFLTRGYKKGESFMEVQAIIRRPVVKAKKKNQNRLSSILLLLLFIAGLSVLLYPAVSDYLNKKNAKDEINLYQKQISNLSEAEIQTQYALAMDYNNSLRGDPVKDPFLANSGRALAKNYGEVMNFNDGVMGTIEIPNIGVELPIYHGSDDEVLKKGVGHIEGTSFPVGGKGNHSVLTGHTGLPSAKLFTDLVDLKIGDRFYIRILDKELVYEVNNIVTVVPTDDITQLDIWTSHDYITLLTCFPYGINSHRLLVRGERVDQISKQITTTPIDTFIFWIILMSAIIIMFIASIILIYDLIRHRRMKKGKKNKKNKIYT